MNIFLPQIKAFVLSSLREKENEHAETAAKANEIVKGITDMGNGPNGDGDVSMTDVGGQ